MVNRGGEAGIPEGEWMICAVCGRVLNAFTRNGEVIEWQHPGDILYADGGEDHAPVPVREADIDVEHQLVEKCDFCHADNPPWVLPVEDFEVVVLGDVQHNSRSDWSCCDDCAELIRKGYWDRLTQRVIKSFKDRHGGAAPPEVQILIRSLYRRLSEHVLGPVQPNPTHRSSREEETGGTE